MIILIIIAPNTWIHISILESGSVNVFDWLENSLKV